MVLVEDWDLFSGRLMDFRNRDVEDVKLPQRCIRKLGQVANSVMIHSLLHALRDRLGQLNVQDRFDDIIQGKVPDVLVATSQVPSLFHHEYQQIFHAYRRISLLSNVIPSLIPVPPQMDRYKEIVSVLVLNSSPEDDIFRRSWDKYISYPKFHFILYFHTP